MTDVLFIVGTPLAVFALIWGLVILIEVVATNLPYRLQRRRFRKRERANCPACNGKPLLLIDGELCRRHDVGFDCTGYHGAATMCFRHEERWARLHAKEQRVLGDQR